MSPQSRHAGAPWPFAGLQLSAAAQAALSRMPEDI